MIDTHAHIDTDAFDEDRDEMLERARHAGVEFIIVPAIEPGGFNNILELAKKEKNIFCGLGVHPHHAHQINDSHLAYIEEKSFDNKVVAIGEIGLDYHYDFCPPDIQKEIFRKQINIAKRTNLPVIIHNRKSDTDMMNILSQEQDGNLVGVLHCFSGDLEMMRQSVDLGFHISFTGNITFKNSKMNEIVLQTPIERILLETDSPYMTPEPNRKKRNEPAFVHYVAEKISEIKSIKIYEVIQMTSNNAKKLFNLNSIIVFLLILTALFSSATSLATAQNNEEQETVTPVEKIPNPYDKGIGIGFDLGPNTIVETQYYQGLKKSVSYEGVFFWGLTINYAMLDYLYLEATYTDTKNTKISEKYPGLGPNIHKVIELTSQWIINPRSKIAFYGMGGLSFFNNTLNKGKANIETSDSPMGFNFGVGFRAQIPFNSVGILDIVAEWRLNWAPTRVRSITFWENGGLPVEIENTKFFSMPRLAVIFYPEFLRFLSLD